MLYSSAIDQSLLPMHEYLSLPPTSILSYLPSLSLNVCLSVFSIRLPCPSNLFSVHSLLIVSCCLSVVIGHHSAKQSSILLPIKTHRHLSSIHWHRRYCHRSFLQKSSQQAVEPFVLRLCRVSRHYRVEDI